MLQNLTPMEGTLTAKVVANTIIESTHLLVFLWWKHSLWILESLMETSIYVFFGLEGYPPREDYGEPYLPSFEKCHRSSTRLLGDKLDSLLKCLNLSIISII